MPLDLSIDSTPLHSPLSSPALHSNQSLSPSTIFSPTSPSCPTSPTSTPFAAGLQPEHAYRSQMSAWRFKIRKCLIQSLDREMPKLISIQSACRSPALDWLMVHSSWLGSHSFFILTLPLLFWFGDSRAAAAQIYILAGGVYFTGVLKDFLCIPRPYSPPVARLSISNHGSEYGFPSTHSATSTSTVLIALEALMALDGLSFPATLALFAGLALYAVLLVFGRVYCGMHSIQDVVFGSAIGVSVWVVHRLLSGPLTRWLEEEVILTGLLASLPIPLLVVLFGLAATASHPQPIDDCPCFEDSTAFVAVTVGVMIAHWAAGPDPPPARPFWPSQPDQLVTQLPRSLAKIVIGLLVLFTWRFTLKELLSRVLPPLFQLAAPLLQLPRRHYLPTSDYGAYRDELRQMRREAGLQATIIPSLVHLPIPQSAPDLRQRRPTPADHHLTPASLDPTEALHPALQNRVPGAMEKDPLGQPRSSVLKNKKPFTANEEALHHQQGWKPPTVVKHHDVDVLMRLMVYSGIGFLAA